MKGEAIINRTLRETLTMTDESLLLRARQRRLLDRLEREYGEARAAWVRARILERENQ